MSTYPISNTISDADIGSNTYGAQQHMRMQRNTNMAAIDLHRNVKGFKGSPFIVTDTKDSDSDSKTDSSDAATPFTLMPILVHHKFVDSVQQAFTKAGLDMPNYITIYDPKMRPLDYIYLKLGKEMGKLYLDHLAHHGSEWTGFMSNETIAEMAAAVRDNFVEQVMAKARYVKGEHDMAIYRDIMLGGGDGEDTSLYGASFTVSNVGLGSWDRPDGMEVSAGPALPPSFYSYE